MTWPRIFGPLSSPVPLSYIDDDLNALSATTSTVYGSALVGYLASFSGSVGRTLQSRLNEGLSVKDFGAVGNGSTDDATKIQTAINTCGAAGLNLFFPAGTYIVGTQLTCTYSNFCMYGESPMTTVLKAKSSSALSAVMQVGASTGTIAISQVSFIGLGFDGNSETTVSALNIRNTQHSSFIEVDCKNSAAVGLKTNTSTTTTNTQQLRNNFQTIRLYSNTGDGAFWQGEKDSRFLNILAYSNGGDGMSWKAFKDDADALAETTQCILEALISRDNTGNGFTFDMIEKFVAGSLISTINTGYGVQFKSSYTGVTSNGSNSINCASMVLRNNGTGQFRMSDSSYVYGAQFGVLYILGTATDTVTAHGINLAGVQAVNFGSVVINGVEATPVLITGGTPLGSTANAQQISFGNLIIQNSGVSGVGPVDSIKITEASNNIFFANVSTAGLATTATTWELNIAGTAGPVFIGSGSFTSSSGTNALSLSTANVNISTLYVEGNPTAIEQTDYTSTVTIAA